jgi:cysteinyl-tRNA synthetase
VQLYNSQSRQKENFIPLDEGVVRIYVCGPTVYDDAHLGHARSALAFDLLRRLFSTLGYHVIFVKNFTDIDDKIIKKLQDSGESLASLTAHYIQSYKDDMHALGIEDADIEPKATENLENIIHYIQNLMEKGYAYLIDDGVYFDVSRDEKYFSLSHREIEDSETQSRVVSNLQKRDPKDFALWKLIEDETLTFDSPWGKGRPGWHIECSAMIKHHLSSDNKAYQIDIHGGGADLLFPHHENEACQSRCESGHELARYWMHNGFVQIDGTKMSKSLGNSFFLKDALKNYHGEILRFYLLSTHYRANFNFNEEDLIAAQKRLDKLYRLKKRLGTQKSSAVNKKFKAEILEKLSDDLNISATLALLDEMVATSNEALDREPKNKALKYEINANLSFIKNLLGIGTLEPYSYFQLGIPKEEIKEIEALIAKRDAAKKAKDYALSDQIRDSLQARNIKLMDTPEGTQWEKGE